MADLVGPPLVAPGMRRLGPVLGDGEPEGFGRSGLRGRRWVAGRGPRVALRGRAGHNSGLCGADTKRRRDFGLPPQCPHRRGGNTFLPIRVTSASGGLCTKLCLILMIVNVETWTGPILPIPAEICVVVRRSNPRHTFLSTSRAQSGQGPIGYRRAVQACGTKAGGENEKWR
jgi:hypothetical protein